MEYRNADKNDIAEISAAKKCAYGYPEEYVKNYMQKLFFPNKCTVCTENDRLISYAQRIDYGMNLRSALFTAGYISDVNTVLDKRRSGHMKGCVKKLLENMHAEQLPFVFCVPFDYKVFDSLGFRLVSDIKEYHITADDIPAYRLNGIVKDDIKANEFSNESFINKISNVYDSYMKRGSSDRLYVMRSNIYWRTMLDDLINGYGVRVAVFCTAAEDISGYLIYKVQKDTLRVYEYAYKDITAYRSIFAFLKNCKYQVKKIIIKAASDDMAYLDFAGGSRLIKIMPFAMARITNIACVLHSLRSKLAGLNIRIFDPLFEQNSGVWSVSETGIMPTSDPYDFETDIGTFTQMYLGYISAADAFYMGYLKNISHNSEKESIMRNAFKKLDNYINMLL